MFDFIILCRLKRRVEFSRIFKKIKIGVVRKSRGRKTLHVYLDTYIYTHTHSIAARSIFATMIPPRSRIARFNGTEIFRLAILGSKQRRSSVKGRQSYKISSMFRCIPPVLKCVRLFRVKRGEKDAPMIRAIDYSVTRVPGKRVKWKRKRRKYKIVRQNFARVLLVLTTFFLSLSSPSSSPFADLVKYLTLHGAESNCHWREFNLRDFTTALCMRAHSRSNFSLEIESFFRPTILVVTPNVFREQNFLDED